MRWIAAFISVTVLVVASVATCMAVESDSLRQKQQAQEKARGLARDLVTGILDIQLRQLRENGLTELPIYAEIQGMQANIDSLVEQQMADVVQLLVLAQEGSQSQRLEHFNQARDKIRDVVVRLMAERQKLLRRLQIARLAAQVRQLITLQSRTRNATEVLPETSSDDRERVALDAIQGQRDVKSLFLVLVETLADVSSWGGQVGAGASDGLRILKAAQVGLELDKAGNFLEAGSFENATTSQRAVIKGLRALLEKIEETRGLISSDREAALKMVREMLEKQGQLREDVRQTEAFSEETLEQLVERQAQIHKSLGTLAEMIEQLPATEPLLEQAKASAYEAAAQLFAENRPETIAEQTRVIGSLAEIEEQLKHAIAAELDDKSAEELAEDVQRLEQLKEDLEAIAEQQAEVVEEAADRPAEASRAEQNVAEALSDATEAAAAEADDLPGVVESRLSDAQAAVDEAMAELADVSESAAPSRQDAAASAEEAIGQALAETKAQLADTRRRQMAVELGELARAAEALERAAASEREIAAAAAEAAQAEGLSAEQLEAIAEEHGEVKTVAEKVEEGVRAAAPKVAEQIRQASEPMATASEQIEAVRQQPGEPSKTAATELGKSAEQASQTLEDAAAALRESVKASAENLVSLADEQLQQVAGVQSPVEQALTDMRPKPSEALRQLQEAMHKVQEARTQQQRASGRAEAAEAAEFARQVSEAVGLQESANQAAEDVVRGKANTPLEAAARQQEAAERAAELAEQTEGGAAQQLDRAARAAAEAARETLSGDPNRAEAAREAATEALDEAMAAVEQAAADAAQAPPGQPDAEAQQRVGQLAGQARQLSEAVAANAAASLGEAQGQSQAAEDAIAAEDTGATHMAQQATGEALDQASEQLKNAAEQLADRLANEASAQGRQAGELAEAAAEVSPDSAAALRAAQRAAQAAMPDTPQPASTFPSDPLAAGEEIERSFERAAASLAARQQQIQRDRDVADALAELTEQQQAAREEISQQSEALAGMAPPIGDNGQQPPPGPEQVSAAQALQQATEQFAQAQRAIGQGAVEISQQQQVANVPLREGLEAASELAMGMPVEALNDLPMTEAVPGDQAAQPAEPGESIGEPQASGSPAAGQPGQAAAQATAPQSGQPASAELGTGLVPSSPEMTAQQIAGPQAVAQAEQTLAMAQAQSAAAADSPGQPQAQAPGQNPAPGADQQQIPGPTSPMASAGGVSVAGSPAINQPVPEQPLELQPSAQGDSRTADEETDTDVKMRTFRQEPWFARLPSSLRKAIEARARRRAPRGYEERLRRYFESID